MLKNKFLILFAAVTFAMLAMTACDSNTTDPDPDPDKPTPASNIQATSINATTVHIKYDVSTSESNTLFKDYEITWKEDGGPTAADSKVVLKGTNPIEVTGLTEGKIYLFTLTARYTNNEVSTSISIKWSPASRFVKNVNDDVIKVYETASDFGSGLQMFYEAEGAPRVRKVANGKDWDLGIRTSDNKLVIGSATKLNYNYPTGQTPDATFFFSDYFTANSLNDVFDTRAMNDADRNTKFTEMTFDLTNFTDAKNIIFYVRKYQPGKTRYNYAKVMIKRPAAGGSFLQGSSPNRFFEFEVSYQKTEDVPYAKISSNNSSK